MGELYRYHESIGFPSNLQRPRGRALLDYSNHALREAEKDRYGRIVLPRSIDFSAARLYECHATHEGQVVIGCYRVQHGDAHYLCLVIDMRSRRVITCFLNEVSDVHHTLRRHLYAVPER